MTKYDISSIWINIPKKIRNRIKKDYTFISQGTSEYELGRTHMMEDYFGKHYLAAKFDITDVVRIKGYSSKYKIFNITENGKYELLGESKFYDEDELEKVD